MSELIEMADAGAAAEKLAPVESTQTEPAVVQPEAVQEQQGDDASRHLQRMERRISRVTAQRYQAEAEARQLREELARLRQPSEQQPERVEVSPADVERLAEQRAEKLALAREVDRRGTEISADLAKLAGKDRVADIVESVVSEAGPLISDGAWTPLGEAISESDSPAALLRYLADNPDTAAELAGKRPAALGRAIARIEAEISARKAAPRPSAAPKPVEGVKSRATPVGPDPSDSAAWIAAENARRASR